MIIRRAHERGYADHGWLKSFHTFSFGEYFDSKYSGFRSLRVINEDRVAPGKGFQPHSHHDMEIISYVLTGALQHKDSTGTSSIIRPGEVQRMSAGTGITHSEFNASEAEAVHFLQIWITPEQQSITPSYEQKVFSLEARENKLCLIASRTGRDGSITIHQDVNVYTGLFSENQYTHYELQPERCAWVQVARGRVKLNDTLLQAGDAAAFTDASTIHIHGQSKSEILLFDLT